MSHYREVRSAVLTVHPSGRRSYTSSVRAGSTLLEALGQEAVQLDTACGGGGRCGKCRVFASGALSPPDESERGLAQGERLACCARVEGDCQVWLPESSKLTQIRIEGSPRAVQQTGLSPLFSRYGAAIDIGTTTLAGQLYGHSGLLAQASAWNPQHTFGADVMTRIDQSLHGQREALAVCIRAALQQLLTNLAAQAGLGTEQVDTIVFTGNTTMLYLLTGQDADALSHAPFQADESFGHWDQALEEVFSARVYLPPCISAFVGADIVTALLASGICDRPDPALLVDIGTNGEMALWQAGRLLCASVAAGPVFEGASLSQGMPGIPGAIEHAAWKDGALVFQTIGGLPARGICGSGVIDLTAALLEGGALEESGLLTTGGSWPLSETVFLTQKDIRMVQLAKGAVYAGIQTLLEEAELPIERVGALAIAGGFGSFLDLEKAVQIGLLPRELAHCTVVLGNAALAGAAMLLLGEATPLQAEALAALAETKELSGDRRFADYYTMSMLF